MSDFLFDALPQWARHMLPETPGYKEWKKCTKCLTPHITTKLRICSGCCQRIGIDFPVYYCSTLCQKNDWLRHKEICQHSDENERRLIRAWPSGHFDINVGKKIYKWRCVYLTLLGWAIQNIYHYNAHLDPHTTVVTFYLDPNSMQISYFVVEELESQELRSPMERPPGTYSFFISISPTTGDSSGTGCCPVFMNIEMGLLGTPEGRAQIQGNPQWPWMVVQLTSRKETSYALIKAKWYLLWGGIRANTRLGLLSLDPEFAEPPSFRLSEIVYIHPHQMARWYAALQSIDFWYPMLRPNPSESLFSKCLQIYRESKLSPDGDISENSTPAAAEALQTRV